MPVDINFERIRPYRGSRNNGFEELCCQLVGLESPSEDAEFVRKEGSGGDAGVECYWRLGDSTEYAWQAKYFFKLGNSQWQQIDDSVRSALEKHSTLRRYTVCLPMDLSEQRSANRVSQRDSWDSRVRKWEEWSKNLGLQVEFVLWGQHELVTRLTRDDPAYSGRTLYWFDTAILGIEWFRRMVEHGKANIGERYTPELNVELPISGVFDGLAVTPQYLSEIDVARRHVSKAVSKLGPHLNTFTGKESNELSNLPGAFEEKARTALDLLFGASATVRDGLSTQALTAACTELQEAVAELERNLERSVESRRSGDGALDSDSRQDLRRYLYQLESALSEFSGFLEGKETLAANTRAIAITGEAGVGKSHLLCDIADKHLADGRPALLLLGQHVGIGNPWEFFLSELDLRRAAVAEFLGALDAAAEAARVRALLLIDAINEGPGSGEWHNRLPGFLQEVSRFPHVAVAISCRTRYDKRLIPSSIPAERLLRVTHSGFAGHEYRAAEMYLGRRGIERPSAPLMAPEFANPLFLKTCSDALVRRGETVFPKGLRGITRIFEFYLESIEFALGERMDVDPLGQVGSRAMLSLATEMAAQECEWVPRDKAKALLEEIVPAKGYRKSLIFHLLQEGALAEDIVFADHAEESGTDVIRFTYQRFSDHFIAAKLLDDNLNLAEPGRSFEPDSPMGRLFADPDSWSAPGILDALSVQIPERCDRELIGLLPEQYRENWAVQEAFVESILWRDPTKCRDETLDWLGQVQRARRDNVIEETLLRIATEPEHHFNADFLHRNLMRHELADRDAFWSVFLAKHFVDGADEVEQSPINVLINWAWNADSSNVEDDRVRLCAIALTWFLTSSHRAARDKATKALVSLLAKRPALLPPLVRMFDSVDDPYVRERLYAVAYGVALQQHGGQPLSDLACTVYELVFREGSPPPHILLRDYARGIIEKAKAVRCLPDSVDLSFACPPYSSPWPIENPTDEEVKQIAGDDYSDILSSVSGFGGDFGTYTMNCVHDWCETPLTEAEPRTGMELLTNFYQKIRETGSPDQIRLLEEALEAEAEAEQVENDVLRPLVVGLKREDEGAPGMSADLSDRNVGARTDSRTQELPDVRERSKEARKAFMDSLASDDREYFRWIAGTAGDRPAAFSRKWAQRWVCKRAYDLGWTSERFQQFEQSYTGRGDRSRPRVERIGKKYQWIAFHELLARLSDNLYFTGNFGEKPIPYAGPWQLMRRDIDPSLLIHQTLHGAWDIWENPVWWRPFGVRFETAERERKLEWVRSAEDLPDFPSLIEVSRPNDGRRWLVLHSFSSWREDWERNLHGDPDTRRDCWFRVQSCLVRQDDVSTLTESLKGRDLRDSTRFESTGEWGEFFLGEYPWHPACGDFLDHWREPDKFGRRGTPVPTLIPTAEYYWESGSNDCSIDRTVGINLPSAWLCQKMGLQLMGGRRILYADNSRECVFLDPSVSELGPSAALVEQARFFSLLDHENLAVVWIVAGEKGLYAEHPSDFWARQVVCGVYFNQGGETVGETWNAQEGSQ